MDNEYLKFIDWVEGRYIPESYEEEIELIDFGERVYPILMHKLEKLG